MAENTKGLSLQKNMAWNSIGSLIYLGCSWLIVDSVKSFFD